MTDRLPALLPSCLYIETKTQRVPADCIWQPVLYPESLHRAIRGMDKHIRCLQPHKYHYHWVIVQKPDTFQHPDTKKQTTTTTKKRAKLPHEILICSLMLSSSWNSIWIPNMHIFVWCTPYHQDSVGSCIVSIKGGRWCDVSGGWLDVKKHSAVSFCYNVYELLLINLHEVSYENKMEVELCIAGHHLWFHFQSSCHLPTSKDPI